MTEGEWEKSEDPAAMLAWLGESRMPSNRKLRLFAAACCRRVWHLLADDAPCPVCDGGKVDVGLWLNEKPCSGCHGTTRVNRSRRVVETAERFADGEATEEEIFDADGHAGLVPGARNNYAVMMTVALGQLISMPDVVGCVGQVLGWSKRLDLRTQLAALLRDIVGNPFRPVVLPEEATVPSVPLADFHGMNPEQFRDALRKRGWLRCPWLTPDVLGIAQAAYGERNSDGTLEWDRLVVLSDALEESGCPTHDICPVCEGAGSVGTNFGSSKYDVSRCRKCWGKLTAPHPLLAALRSEGPHYRGFWALDLILGKE